MKTLRCISQGELTGQVAANGALAWRGIPYAQPPVGELRWKAPRPPLAWRGRLAAIKDGPACFQSLHLAAPFVDTDGDGFIGGEDCLYLNIFAPADSTPADRLPVMYWIYGGGNVGGHNASPAYDGSVLAQTHRVVVVTINYRLGMLGWFLHPALARLAGRAEDRSGNWGTLDTIRGLAWVREQHPRLRGRPGQRDGVGGIGRRHQCLFLNAFAPGPGPLSSCRLPKRCAAGNAARHGLELCR